MNNLPFTTDELNEQIALGYVKETKHPEFDLFIYNYSNSCQYDGAWNNVTNNCRGLILDKDKNIVARPFSKFHNYSEHIGQGKDIPEGYINVTEKMDGSLGVLYWYEDKPYIATRGSFISDQAIEATKMFNKWFKLSNTNQTILNGLKDNVTYLFEIIYPQNRIVVDYNSKEQLVMIGCIDNDTGKDLPLPSWYPFVVPDFPQFKSMEDVLMADQTDNYEGFVVRFENGLRLKVKFDEYVRLHRLLTQTTARSIWDVMRQGKSLDELIELVPDEFYDWVKSVQIRLDNEYSNIYDQAINDFNLTKQMTVSDSRKDVALWFSKCRFPSLLFLLLDGKMERFTEVIWKMIRPAHEIPFKMEV